MNIANLIFRTIGSLVIIFVFLQLSVWIYQNRALKKLDYSLRFSSKEAYEGDGLLLIETIVNKKLLPLPWLRSEIHTSKWLEYAKTHSVIAQDSRKVTSCFQLGSYKRVLRKWKLKCIKRGIYTIHNTTLVSADPLGMARVSRAARVEAELLVYPEIVNLDEFLIPVNLTPGDNIVRRWIIDDPFIVEGIREYSSGDPMNRIHWGMTARYGRLMAKKNEFTSFVSMAIFLNTQSFEYEYADVVNKENLEAGIKVAASLVEKASEEGMQVCLLSNGQDPESPSRLPIVYPSASGPAHGAELLKALSSLDFKSVRHFDKFIKDHAGDISQSEVFIITAYLNDDIATVCEEMEYNGNTIKIIYLSDDYYEKQPVFDSVHGISVYLLADQAYKLNNIRAEVVG